ncbi:MAG: hypothetical protein M3529_13250 [Actinomycetota bacterium]|nr:hypothetical protein [Actinomycetota bacterium]
MIQINGLGSDTVTSALQNELDSVATEQCEESPALAQQRPVPSTMDVRADQPARSSPARARSPLPASHIQPVQHHTLLPGIDARVAAQGDLEPCANHATAPEVEMQVRPALPAGGSAPLMSRDRAA